MSAIFRYIPKDYLLRFFGYGRYCQECPIILFTTNYRNPFSMKQFRGNMAHRIHQRNLPTPLLFGVSFCKINIFLRKRIVFQNFSYLCSDFLKHKAYELSSYSLSITADFKLQPIVNTWFYKGRNTDETYYIPNYYVVFAMMITSTW